MAEQPRNDTPGETCCRVWIESESVSRSAVATLCDPWAVSRPAPMSMDFFRQEYWSGLPFPPPGLLPDPGIEPMSLMSPALSGRFFTTRTTWAARFSSVQFSGSVTSDSLRPHESQHTSLPVHHQLPEFTQTHVHRVSDAIQPFHPLSSPSPPAPNPSQHQGLFQSQFFVSSGQSIGVSASASFLPKNTQD